MQAAAKGYNPGIQVRSCGKIRVRIVAAMFTVAMIYASVCSTTCAFGACAAAMQQAPGHECEHSSGSHRPAPQSPDCGKHLHPQLNVVKANNFSLPGLTWEVAQTAADGGILDLHSPAASLNCLHSSDLAPPALNNSLLQRISILRV
jgi:hypothetical protein